MKVSKSWRNKPLFRRQGDVRFKTGMEASNLLIREAKRRDAHEKEYIDSVTATMQCLSPVFDRNPKYAFAAKTLMEPERFIQFRVAWIDDMGVNRLNRGYRVQYSSSLGPYGGSLHFGPHVNTSVIHSIGFDTIFSNALTGMGHGAAVGGSDFNPLDKSESEMQRFCQSYMTELSKYVGVDQDIPWMGKGVGPEEMGYMFGQYKRITGKSGAGVLLSSAFQKAPGYGIAHFLNEIMKDKKDTLQGKRVMIIGSGGVAQGVARKLVEYGAKPITLSDLSGHIYEPDGFTDGKLTTIDTIKADRGALLGRYIISSTTAQFNHPENILEIPCDICIPCGGMNDIDEAAVNMLADNGCKLIAEGGNGAVTSSARKIIKKRGMQYAPYTMTMTGPALMQNLGKKADDASFQAEIARVYSEVKSTASEFNARGDLFTGSNIAGFLRVANVMMAHGAV
eukprot:CAMPEP_0176004382 /NCGR_PEP_ID=MMETSP0120_2-20121206/1664_1 /TAXON_ID=160619 /ORGANISM="Kryptoperidinium foliaceum, Strain CCMP 1326" /LENGTH=450 /DNA_ID=CAMNT_0017337061 /DNA_START=699 /DNA_END=2051 /DNA_ORIENTATION=-